MKSNASLLFPAILALILFTAGGCKKEDRPTCRIITISSAQAAAASISYDERGRVQTILQGFYVRSYTYTGDTCIIVQTNNGVFDTRKIIVNNSNGLATNVRTELNSAATNWFNSTYEYNASQLIKSTTTSSFNAFPQIRTYQWENGNPVRSTLLSSGLVEEQEFDESKVFQAGDFYHTLQLLQGYETLRPRNLVKKLGSGETISYGFDSEGRIESRTMTQGANSTTYTHQYQCN